MFGTSRPSPLAPRPNVGIIDFFTDAFPINGPDDLKKLQNNTLQIPHSPELTKILGHAFVTALLLGADHASSDLELADDSVMERRAVPLQMADQAGDQAMEYIYEPLPFEEAAGFLKDRIPLSKKAYYALEPKLRFRAFTVGRLAQYDAIEAVRQSLISAQSGGKTFAQFWEETGKDAILKKSGFKGPDPWYWETVYRINIQTDYNAGRLMQFRESPPKYMEFIGIVDERQSKICRARTGVQRPYGDSFWGSNWPPLHFG